MQMDLRMEIVDDAVETLKELEPHAREMRLDNTFGKAIAKGFEFRVTGGGDRVTKESFEQLARSVGTVLRVWLPPNMSKHCQSWSIPEFVFYEALMTWAHTRGDGASGEVYCRSLYDPVRAAKGLLRSMKQELWLLQAGNGAPLRADTPVAPARDDAVPRDLISKVDAAGIGEVSEQTIRNRVKDGTLRGYGSKVSKKEVEDKLLLLRQRSHARPKRKRTAPDQAKQPDAKTPKAK